MHPKNGKNKPVIWIKYWKMWLDIRNVRLSRDKIGINGFFTA
jgi:hypothetical protein